DCTGVCVEVPGQDIIPPRAKVRSYPLVERYHWVWIWMGDPALADPSRIPNWWWADHPDWKSTCPELIHVKCHYQLVNDNVLDVSHLAYVHQNSIGSAAINEFPVVVEREENSVRMKRWIIDRPAPPMYQAAGRFAGKVDRWQIVEHVPPCFSVNLAGCQDTGTGAPEGNKTGRRIDLMALSAPTPETAGTTHYFFQFVRGFQLDDPTAERMFAVDFVNVFREDIVIFEAQQRAIDRNPNAPKIDLKVDAAPLAARRMLDFMVKGERACTSLS
ncbi:MAG: aromatic ring-hydroxylating dioxygenase subunit alpha, partial [Burkholderiales bacterium]